MQERSVTSCFIEIIIGSAVIDNPSGFPLVLLLLAFAHEDLVGHGVPCVVDADEEQEECDSADDEQRGARVRVCQACGCNQNCVCDQRKKKVEQPVFEYGLVSGLRSHTAG